MEEQIVMQEPPMEQKPKKKVSSSIRMHSVANRNNIVLSVQKELIPLPKTHLTE